jgi:hypothetical protein
MKDALAERAAHALTFEEFNAIITLKHHSVWLAEMQAWEDNPNDTSICNLLKAKAMGEYFLLLYSYLGLIILSSYNTSRSKAKARGARG